MAFFTYLIGGVILGAATYKVAESLIPDTPPAETDTSRDIIRTLNPDYKIPVVYGEQRLDGNIIFYDVTGTDNKYLDIVVAVCEGEIEGFTKVYMDNGSVPIFDGSGSTLTAATELEATHPTYGKYYASGELTFPSTDCFARVVVNGVYFYGKEDGSGDFLIVDGDISTTLDNLVTVLNSSGSSSVNVATYSKVGTDVLKIVHDTIGTSGNDFTVSAATAIYQVRHLDTTRAFFSPIIVKLSGGNDTTHIHGYFYNGTSSQTANSQLSSAYSAWTSTHKLENTAYAYFRLTHNPDLFSGGIPRFTFEVQGKKVYDPNNGAHIEGDETTWKYSANPALCLRDYLTSSRYGKGLSGTVIDDTSFIFAASDCDTLRSGLDVTGAAITYKSYEVGAVVDTEKPVKDNVQYFLQSMNGTLPYFNGKYYLNVLKAGNAVVSFTADNIIGQISLASGGKRDRYNRVQITFPDKDRNFKEADALIESSPYLTEDNNEVLEKRLEAPYINYYPRAKDLAELIMNLSRRGLSVSFTTTLEVLKAVPGDIIDITYDTFGWSGKEFRLEEISIRSDGLCDITASEHDDTFYSLSTQQERATPTDTNLVDLRVVQRPTIVDCYSDSTTVMTSVEGLVKPRIYVSWRNNDPYPSEYLIFLKKPTESSFTKVGQVTKDNALSFYIPNVEWGEEYDVGIVTQNGIGYNSPLAVNTTTVPNPLAEGVYTYPNVKGLELVGRSTNEGQGNDTEFQGKDIRLQWRLSSNNVTFEFGSLDAESMGVSGGVKPFTLTHYRVEVFHPLDTEPRQSYNVTNPNFTYTLDKNIEDGGPSRTVTFHVYAVGQVAGLGIVGESSTPSKITVTNPKPSLPTITVSPKFKSITVEYTKPTDADFAGVRVWMAAGSTVSAIDANLVYDGSDTRIELTGLDTGTQYTLKLSPYDDFGTDDTIISAGYSVTTLTLNTSDGLSDWAFQVTDADRTFINDHLSDDAVPSTKIENLTAAKITTGTLAATETITSEGVIKAVNDINAPVITTAIGPRDIGGTIYLLSADYTGSLIFGVDESGNAEYNGSISVGAVEDVLESGTTITGGGIQLSSGGALYSNGMSDETPVIGGGVWLGYNSTSTKYTFCAGDTTNFITYDGTSLLISGLLNAGSMKLGVDVNGTNDGIYIDANNYWYDSGLFKVGDATKYLQFDGTDVSVGRETQILGADAYNNDTYYYSTVFDSLDGWVTSGAILAGGSLAMSHNGAGTSYAYRASFSKIAGLVWTANRRFKTTVTITRVSGSTYTAYIVMGWLTGSEYFGFKIVDDVIYGVKKDGTTETVSSSYGTLTSNQDYLFECEYVADDAIYLYIDGVLQGSLSAPTASGLTEAHARKILEYYTNVTSTSGFTLSVHEAKFLQDP